MRENALLQPTEIVEDINNDALIFTLLNTRSLPKHAIDIHHDKSIMGSDIVFLTETRQ